MMHTLAPVAQLDRASDYGSEGCEFESRRAHHKNTSKGVFLYKNEYDNLKKIAF